MNQHSKKICHQFSCSLQNLRTLGWSAVISSVLTSFFDERFQTEILALVSSVYSGEVRRVTKNALHGKAIRAFLIAEVNIQK